MPTVLILGATGRIGKRVAWNILNAGGYTIKLYVRSPEKIAASMAEATEVIEGDVLDTKKLAKAVEGCDWVVACLNGNPLRHALSLVNALEGKNVGRVIWLTQLGVQDEVRGLFNRMITEHVRHQPELVASAHAIHNCSTPSLLVRAPDLTDGPETPYITQNCGEFTTGLQASRATIARFISDAVERKMLLVQNDSIGVFDAPVKEKTWDRYR